MAFWNRKRQSAPRETAEGFLARMIGRGEEAAADVPIDAKTLNEALVVPIGREKVADAELIRQKYASGKAAVDRKIIENEKIYRMNAYDGKKQELSEELTKTGWLFNAIANKHADAMDNYPAPVILPREPGDKAQADALSHIIPAVLEKIDFQATYSDVQLYKFKQGSGVYFIGWDPNAEEGCGEIAIRKVDLLNLFWEPGVCDIQDSPNLFYAYLVDNDTLISAYPALSGKLGGNKATILDYQGDETVDTSTKSTVVEWYYKRRYGARTVVHFVKYVNDIVLYATENGNDQDRTRGLYDHGRYPFEVDTFFKVEGSPVGLGLTDICKSDQAFIDRLWHALGENALQGAKPRYFERIDGSINEEEFNDFSKTVVHVAGNLGEDSVRPIESFPLHDAYMGLLDRRIDSLKEISGNRDVSTGGTTSGVTAASAIAAMQEAGAKLTRDSNKTAYNVFRQIVLDMIELIRQFYDIPRQFRILGEDGQDAFVEFENSGLAPVPVRDRSGAVVGYKTPVYDVKVSAEKQSPYSRMAQNELAIQLWNLGVLDPRLSDQALMLLKIMDIDNKHELMTDVAENGTMADQIDALQQMIVRLCGVIDAAQGGGDNAAKAAQMFGATGAVPLPTGTGDAEPVGESFGGESSTTAKAREKAARATEVR